MKIAVFGYYNALNAGDDRIQYCITKLLQGHTVVFLPHYLLPPKEYLQTFDWILIGGGGLVFNRVGIWENVQRWTQNCRAKIGFFGLGVNHVSPELLQEVLTLVDRSEFCYVRDKVSKALLDDHPKVEVHPDLSWYFPIQVESHDVATDDSSGNGIALNLLPCHWKTFEAQAWVEALSDFEVHPFPLNFKQDRDFALLNQFYGDRTPTEFSLKPLLESKIVVAARFHAIIFAMQFGKPFVAINYDYKIERLLAEADLLDCCLETTEHNLLQDKVTYVLENQAALKQKITAYAELQESRAQKLAQSIHAQLEKSQDTLYKDPWLSLKTTAKTLLGMGI